MAAQASRVKGVIPYTFFGVIAFPLVTGVGLVMIFGSLRRRSLEGCVLALALFILLWSLAVPCATNGVEGNRMRFATVPLFLIIFVHVVSRGRRWLEGQFA